MEEQMARFESARNSPGQANESEPPRFVVGDSKTEADAPPPDASSYLRDALRKPAEDETRVQGSLVRIDCDAKGITFVVKVDDRVIKLHTDKFQNVRMVAFSADAGMEINCGPRKSETSVVICYVPLSDPKARFEGTIKSIEFVPKDFKLKG